MLASMDATTSLPSLFLSHGSPMLAIEDSRTGRFLDRLSDRFPRPRAILVASAHFMAPSPTLTTAVRPATIHDFGGFPAPLYDIRYPAPGAPDLATKAAGLLAEAGFDARQDPDLGIDHGVWVPLRRIYPEADIPVVALSVDPRRTSEWHYRLGRALAPLRAEGVLVVGSGGFSHNLRALAWREPDAPEFTWVSAFTGPLREKLLAGDANGALDWTSLPEALRNHPTPEHLYPLYVALGAGGEGARGQLLHRDVEMGGLALDAFAFDGVAR